MSSHSPCYYLVSCAGVPNYGDELIIATWLRFLAEIAPEAEVIVDCIRPEHADKTLGSLHPSVTFADTLWMLCLQSPKTDPLDVVEHVTDTIRGRPRAADRPGVDAMTSADVVHLVGGGLLNGLYPWTLGLVAGVVAAAERSGGRSALTGQGLCPQREELVPHLRQLIARLDVADVRDEPSAELLGLSEVMATVDDVFLELGPHLYRGDEQVPEVMVCAQSDLAPGFNASTSAADLASYVLRAVRAWDVPATRIGFLEGFPGMDHQVFDLVAMEIPGVRFYSAENVIANGLPAATNQTWISTRFHPHLVAGAAGASGIALSVVPGYYDVKHGSLADQGSRWHIAANLDTPARPTDGGFAAETLLRHADEKRTVANRVYLRE